MKLDTLNQRHRAIEDLIKKAFEIEESLVHSQDGGKDWGGVMSTVENLIVVEEMICAEEIFLGTLSEMEDVHSRNEEKEIYLSIVDDNLISFIDTVLLRRMEFAFDHLNGWDFKTDGGKKFKKNHCKRLDALIKKYQEVYNL